MEPKFRVWDKDAEQMYYQGSNSDRDNGVLSCSIIFDEIGATAWTQTFGEDYLRCVKNCVIMAGTGLKDKNGVEIYEGDIGEDARGFRFVVIWDDCNTRFLGRGIGKQREYIRYVGQEPAVNVVGNIHENPDLLKGAAI